MGNVGSYISSQSPLEQSIGPVDEAKTDVGSHQTPTRCSHKLSSTNQFFDPRSPTVDINRTPIIVSVSSFSLCYCLMPPIIHQFDNSLFHPQGGRHN